MAEILLSSEAFIKSVNSVSDNLSGKYILPSLREAQEESGAAHVRPVSTEIFSVEVLNVEAHHRRGVYVPSHLHLNVTYLLEDDDSDRLRAKPDENSAVRWFSADEVLSAVSEPCMLPIYGKLLERVKQLS